ncbi:hypothetical protein [uncultured Bacteroides sp.]|nr:hypothetical protein [uncultured Bacteroides sp.]
MKGLHNRGDIYRMIHDGQSYEELFCENREPVRQKKKSFWTCLKK